MNLQVPSGPKYPITRYPDLGHLDLQVRVSRFSDPSGALASSVENKRRLSTPNCSRYLRTSGGIVFLHAQLKLQGLGSWGGVSDLGPIGPLFKVQAS